MHKTIINTKCAPTPVGPYNQSVACNGILYMSGQIAIDSSSGKLITENIKTETKQVLENIGHILKEADLTFADIIKCSVFVKNMDDYACINQVYASFFDEKTAPARELVEVSRLPKDANIEISVIAALK